ncbi:MAG: hypothetical protein ACI9JL_003915 [Paracoccaceae bacterium]|jgi:hypothetical protein
MNKSVISFAAALLSASALVAATSAQADQTSMTSGTQSIGINLTGGAPQITVRNVGNTNKIADLQLAVQEPHVSIGMGGHVDCKGTTSENWKIREGAFLSGGAFGVGRTSLVMSKALPNSSDINHVSDMDAHTFNLSFAKLAGAQIGVNPTALIMAAANSAPNKVAYLQQNHTINVTVPIRWEATCAEYLRNKVFKQTTIEGGQPKSFITKDITLKIKYQGDPDLQYGLNAQIGNLGQGGGVQAAPQNFINITGGSFIEGIKNLKTKCPANAAFKVRVTGQGNGHVKIQVADGGSTVATSQSIELVNGKAEFAFSQHLLSQMAGKGDDHQYRIYYSKKTLNDNFFPAAYQSIGTTFDWSHTCIKPISVGVGLGGNGTIQTQGQQGNSKAPATLGFKPTTQAPVLGKAAPAAGKPARAKTRPARATTPVAPLKKLMIPATPAKPARATN